MHAWLCTETSGPAALLARSSVVREAYLGAAAADTHSASEAAHRTTRVVAA